mmetsp:Transcript_104610/g.301631  ORF Transcript_104610/g.301631 Transcript_104610/m.301631 type:complete len:493 (-) Transcript_104610:1544-3022(-)|eukprot:CAMPEP_0119474552 /NCGR_PEP_ID=MMETSP1344-20130328/5760_1 /TAXON_ID=236787 /ORGANISM="Florenciella parvula, Strain CCMP2471" /LENGTH=492 /DNA_ID=CAMNT_0007507875 /DNA_START=175 /DNA_END=1653 /DNA_ORIENTATION=+
MGNKAYSTGRGGEDMGGFEVDGSDPASKKNVEERIDKQKALAAARPKGEGELGKCEELLHELDAPDLSFDPTGAWLRLESTQTFVDPPTKLGRAVPHIGAAAGNVHADYIAAADAADATAGRLRFVCISDTHGGHRGTHLPRGDVLVHTGDFTNTGETHQVHDFCEWLVEQKHAKGFRHVVVIAGNHDVTLEPAYYSNVGAERFHQFRAAGAFNSEQTRAILTGEFKDEISYLEDELLVVPNGTPEGCRIWGSPWQPEFSDWAFNLERGPPMREVCAMIPDDVDVLLTHGPPLGRGDKCKGGGHRAGCVDLLRTIQKRVKPRVHVFGHVHEGAGVTHDGHTAFVNASTMTFQYRATNSSVTFDLDATAPDGSPKPPAVIVRSAVSEWAAEQVEAWLDAKVLGAVAAAKGGEATKGGSEAVPGEKTKEPFSVWEDAAVATLVAEALKGLGGVELCALDSSSLGNVIGDYDLLRPIKVQSGILRSIRELETQHT